MPSKQDKGKGKAPAPAPYVPSPIILEALEANLLYVHTWIGSLNNRLIAKVTEDPQMFEEFRKNASFLNDLHRQIVRFRDEIWISPALQIMATLSLLADDWKVPGEEWMYGDTEFTHLLEVLGWFDFDSEPPEFYLSEAPRSVLPSTLPRSTPPASPVVASGSQDFVMGSPLAGDHLPAISSPVAGPSTLPVAGSSKPVQKRKAPNSPTAGSSRTKRPKVAQSSIKKVAFVETSDDAGSPPPIRYKTRSRSKKTPMATASESETMVADPPSKPLSSKDSNAKRKKRTAPILPSASVEELWASSAPSHVFPESWIGEARNMDLQLNLGEAKLSLESILKAGRSVTFFDRFTPCGRCIYFGYADCKPLWAASGKSSHRPTCARCFAGKQKCSYFNPDDSQSGLKKLEAASSNNLLLAKIALRLHRELQAYDDLRIAQMAAYKSARSVWKNIQESQRLLRAAGRDPVEVFKGLQTDEDFKMTSSEVKALGDALGWSLSGTAVEEVEENAPPSIPLPSSSTINLPASVATSGVSEKVSADEEEEEEGDSDGGSSDSASAEASSAIAKSTTVQDAEDTEDPSVQEPEVAITAHNLIDDEAEEASSEDSSDGEETDEEETADWKLSPSDLEGLSPVARAVMEKLARERLAYEKAFGHPMYRKRRA
ncbi:hypothetical protein E1B28_007446 [Marasmius oreades]|uniref:Uncharacterized protein n=1 Tax=Marasmius oreades TaxID=181124 RepID=A0A9P7S1K5_9AGAR|nr:uncharacterized protein E1B28_007446 [Marasmius oreades]KAG7093804.1 hypothetical protein E1B28_007446 [Marasmius oreades]